LIGYQPTSIWKNFTKRLAESVDACGTKPAGVAFGWNGLLKGY
jgi:hypothetical protein